MVYTTSLPAETRDQSWYVAYAILFVSTRARWVFLMKGEYLSMGSTCSGEVGYE